ncbi:MAG: inositol monophosphatase family protein [Acidobacteriota bacterium]|nr:inositol monophosphatase family protein [Acidobacteriota bacterium]
MIQDYLALARDIAGEAGRLTLEYFQRGVGVETKSDGTPVTEADRRAEELIRRRIEAECPGHGILGEEFGDDSADASHRWIIDPIDGTLAFSRGVPLYATLVALEVEGRVRIGVAEFPALGETVWAAEGSGCFWNGRRCRVRETVSLAETIVAYTEPESFAKHGKDEAWRRVSEAVRYRVGWRDGYGHALVATGRIEAMLDPVMSPWDCGPFAVILPQAGGYFGDWSGNESIYAGEAMSAAPGILPRLLELTGGR